MNNLFQIFLVVHPYVSLSSLKEREVFMLSVELDIYSGMPNPVWSLSSDEEQELVDRVVAEPSLMRPVGDTLNNLGYRGLIVRETDAEDGPWARASLASGVSLPKAFRIGGYKESSTSEWLYELSEEPEKPVAEEAVWEEALSSLQEELSSAPDAEADEHALTGAGMSCVSNYFTGTNFSFWNGASYIRHNNCYNFAANNRTNTFAQPGRGAGQPFQSLSYSHMQAALQADGWYEGCVPSNNLTIVLVIWPGYDFHFYRLITSYGLWGHKPGQTAAKYTDDSGQNIYNPETCDRGPYTLFYGYWYINSYANVN